MLTYVFTLKRRWPWLALAVLLIAPLLVIAWRLWLTRSYAPQIYTTLAEVPPYEVALVFGAGIRHNRPSVALADRIEAAAALYHAGKVKKLLMTGDNGVADYNEPLVMKSYAEMLGVPAADIVLDYAGRRTYDSCYRAGAIFGLDRVILVTQAFHQARAAYLCDRLGLEMVGFVAGNRRFGRRTQVWWLVRETLASVVAWWDINIGQPTPILGEPLLIKT
jgi:SanA protein